MTLIREDNIIAHNIGVFTSLAKCGLVAALLAFSSVCAQPMLAEAAPSIQLLALPKGYDLTFANAHFAAGGGTVAATVQRGGVTSVAVWRGDGGAQVLLPPPLWRSKLRAGSQLLGTVTHDGTVLGYASYMFGDPGTTVSALFAYGNRGAVHRMMLPDCGVQSGENSLNAIAMATEEKTLAVTIESRAYRTIENLENGSTSPIAALISDRHCRVIGRGTLLALRGRYGAGYRDYAGKFAGSSDWGGLRSRRALRWDGQRLRELGPGVVYGVDSKGLCVGANDKPAPQATIWDAVGKSKLLASSESEAYAIDEKDRIIGRVKDNEARFRAVIWHDGQYKILDDLLKDSSWQLESAFAFTADGGIVGAGIHEGRLAGFVLHL